MLGFERGLEQGRFSLSGFYLRRIRRIFPALALVLAATLVIGWFLLRPADYIELEGKVGLGVRISPYFFHIYMEARNEIARIVIKKWHYDK